MMTYIIYYKINKCQGFGPAGEQEEEDLVSVTEHNNEGCLYLSETKKKRLL
jgi:hypothetical protein